MATIDKINLSTTWGDVQNTLNKNFESLNEGKVEIEEGSRLITKEEIEKLGKLKEQVQADLNQKDETDPSFVKGKKEFENTVAERAALNTSALIKDYDENVVNPKLQDQHNEFITPTLQAIPNNGTISYEIAGKKYNFKVGQLARVLSGGEYVFYQLVNILNDRATWKLMGSGGSGPGPSPVSDYAKGFVWQELINPADEVPLTGVTPVAAKQTINVMDGEIISGTANLYTYIDFVPSNATDTECKWESTNPDIEIKDGVIVGLPNTYPFTATISATSIYDKTLKASFTLDINEIISLISVEIGGMPTLNRLILNGTDQQKTHQLTYTIRPVTGTVSDKTWSSSNPENISVTEGLITAEAVGNATIKLVLSDGYETVEDSTDVITVGTIPKTLSVVPNSITWDKPTSTSTKDPISVTVGFTPADATWGTEMEIDYSPKGENAIIQELVSTGAHSFNVVLNNKVGEGSVSIKLKDSSNPNITPIEFSLPVNVTYTAIPLQSITVEPSVINLYKDTAEIPAPIQLDVTKNPANANEHSDITYSSTNTNVATVDTNGLITFTSTAGEGQINLANDDLSVAKFVPFKVTNGHLMTITDASTTQPTDQPDPTAQVVDLEVIGVAYWKDLAVNNPEYIIEGSFKYRVINPDGEINTGDVFITGSGTSTRYQVRWMFPSTQINKAGIRKLEVDLNGQTYYYGKWLNLQPLTRGAYIYTDGGGIISPNDWATKGVGETPVAIALIIPEEKFRRLVWIPENVTVGSDGHIDQNQLGFGSNIGVSTSSDHENVTDEQWELVSNYNTAKNSLGGKKNTEYLRGPGCSYERGEFEKGNPYHKYITFLTEMIAVGSNPLTGRGKWLIPAYGEIQRIAENIESINECLAVLKKPKYPKLNTPNADFSICSSTRYVYIDGQFLRERKNIWAFKNLNTAKQILKTGATLTIIIAMME